MLLRGSLDFVPVSLLANPQLETPFLYPENHRNSYSGEELPISQAPDKYLAHGVVDRIY